MTTVEIKTSKGAKAIISFVNDRFTTQIVNGPKFSYPSLRINSGRVHVGSMKGSIVELAIDSENAKILQSLIDCVDSEKASNKKAEYKFLTDQLISFSIENGNDDKKAQELLNHAENLKYYSGQESEGLNLSVSKQKHELLTQAQTFCNHNLSEKIDLTLTSDSRKKAVKSVTCCKCKMVKTTSVSAS
jgi:hypothetical protein